MDMKNKRTKMGILVAILVLAIGFAAVTTTLYINGTINIAPDTEGLENGVVFASAKLSSSVYDPASFASIGEIKNFPNEGANTITFSTGTMKSIGETVTLTYTIKNTSSYNAKMGKMTCKLYDVADPTDETTETSDGYLEVEAQNVLENKILGTNKVTGEDTVTVKMIKSFAGDTLGNNSKDYTVRCKITVQGTNEDPTAGFGTAITS